MKTSKIVTLLALAVPATLCAGVATTEQSTPIQSATQSDWIGGVGIGTQLGTQGAGIHLSYNLTQSLYFKVEGNYFKYNDSLEIDSVDYDGDLDLSNLGITANYLPFDGYGFRITAGAFFSNNEFNGRASGAGETVEIDDIDYLLGTGDALRGSVEYNSFNPYIGIGWDWAFGASQNFIFGLEVGVSYFGDPESTLTVEGGLADLVPVAGLEAERQSFQDDAEDYKFFPVVKISLTYRF